MVVLNPRFTLLAALSSIAAISLLPTSVEAAAIQLQSRVALPLASRHSSHGPTKESAAEEKSDSSSQKSKQASMKKASAKHQETTPQRHPRPVMPLPARMAQKGLRKGAGSTKGSASEGGKHSDHGSKHVQSSRATWDSPDPISRVQRLWLGTREMPSDSSTENDGPPRLSSRHHHHDHPDHKEVIVKGDHDHVKVHGRSLTPGYGSLMLRDDHDHIIIEGHNDHVHDHAHDYDRHDHVVVKGDNDHLHLHRSPSPRHHDHHEKVVVKGDHDSVHVHRSPEPAPHHHHHYHDEVVVKGDHDHINVHRRSPAPHRHHHHGEVVIKGNNQHVNLRRSPSPSPGPHHHHHHHHHDADNVVVKGDNDHINVHRRRQPGLRRSAPIVITGNYGEAYLVSHSGHLQSALSGGLLDMNLHLRRDELGNGVPGSIDIMVCLLHVLLRTRVTIIKQSEVAGSDVGQRIASLVLAAPSNRSTSDNSTSLTRSTFVLDASDTDRTQMYLVPTPDSAGDSSTSNATASNTTVSNSFMKVSLQMPVFEEASAQLKPYCATFDPRPDAPAPMTVESCMDGSSNDEHKSQIFAYEPGTGIIRPMWFEGEDDGISDGNAASRPDDPSDDDQSNDDDGGVDDPNGTNTTTVDPTTPASDKVASVTSFEQEALDERFGDATRPPARMASAKTFTTETLSGARNVTLVFSPAAPAVPPPPPPAEKAAASPSGTDSGASSTVAVSMAITSTSTGAASTDTAVISPAALGTTGALTSSGLSASSSTSTVTFDSSAPGSDSTTVAAATSSPELEVKVYNPYAEAITSGTAPSPAATFSVTVSSTDPTMTPVSTAPYEWMFRQGSLADLE
ncbi:hypothetical protein BD414DRAFT_520368 [Trametes punicea]|nr:hypothetical protein BD414DRAFT_520368 [Trametes punicea]